MSVGCMEASTEHETGADASAPAQFSRWATPEPTAPVLELIMKSSRHFLRVLAFCLLVVTEACSDPADLRDVDAQSPKATFETALDKEMHEWAELYRLAMEPVVKILPKCRAGARADAILKDTNSRHCNRLVATIYNATTAVPTAPDPDIEELLRERVLKVLLTGAKVCARGSFRSSEDSIAKAVVSLRKLEDELVERYFLPGLDSWKEFSEAMNKWCRNIEASVAGEMSDLLSQVGGVGDKCLASKKRFADFRDTMEIAADPAVDAFIDRIVNQVNEETCSSTGAVPQFGWTPPPSLRSRVAPIYKGMEYFLGKTYGIESCGYTALKDAPPQ